MAVRVEVEWGESYYSPIPTTAFEPKCGRLGTWPVELVGGVTRLLLSLTRALINRMVGSQGCKRHVYWRRIRILGSCKFDKRKASRGVAPSYTQRIGQFCVLPSSGWSMTSSLTRCFMQQSVSHLWFREDKPQIRSETGKSQKCLATANSPQIIGDIHLTIKKLKKKISSFLKKKMLFNRPPQGLIYMYKRILIIFIK